jgi:hypothetical protein
MEKMKRDRAITSIITAITAAFLLFSQLAFAMDPSVAVLGDVVGKGATEMKTAFNKWISVSDKAYPLINGAHLRSGDGVMSSLFRDGARMEIGKNSEIIVTGARGNYAVDLGKGKIAFSLPQGVSFSVMTPTAAVQTQVLPNMIQNVSTAQDYVRGTVGYDGRGTTIAALSGTLMVKDSKGAAAHTVTAGNSIYIAGTESGYRSSPAQLAQVEGKGSAPAGGNPDADREYRGISPFIVVGGFVALQVGGFAAAKTSNNKSSGGVASPSVP